MVPCFGGLEPSQALPWDVLGGRRRPVAALGGRGVSRFPRLLGARVGRCRLEMTEEMLPPRLPSSFQPDSHVAFGRRLVVSSRGGAWRKVGGRVAGATGL